MQLYHSTTLPLNNATLDYSYKLRLLRPHRHDRANTTAQRRHAHRLAPEHCLHTLLLYCSTTVLKLCSTLLTSTTLLSSPLLLNSTHLWPGTRQNGANSFTLSSPAYYTTLQLSSTVICSALLFSPLLLYSPTLLLYYTSVQSSTSQDNAHHNKLEDQRRCLLYYRVTLLYSTLHSTPPNSYLLYSTLLLYSTTQQLSYSAEPPSLSRTAGNTTQGPERACRHAVRGKEGHTPPRTISK